MNKLYESTYYQFEHDNDRMINRWKNTTENMSFQEFKDALMNLAGFALEYQTSKLLIDTRSFKFQLPPENEAFRNDVFNPRIAKLGTIRQALIMPKEYMQYVRDELGDGVLVPTRYFADESEAIAWLDSAQ